MLKKITIIISIVLMIISILLLLRFFGNFQKSATLQNASQDRLYTLKRNDLTLGIELTGTVNAKKQYNLSCEVSYPTSLISIVDENTKVKKGDILAEFEKEGLIEKIEDLTLSLENERKELSIREEEKDILVSSNQADIEKAENQVGEAQDAFNKYWKLEGPKAKEMQANNVDRSEREVEEAENEYFKYKDEVSQTIYSDVKEEEKAKSQLANFEQTLKSRKTTYNNALIDQKILKRYTHPNKITALKNRLDEVKLNLKRVKIKTASSMIQKDNQLYQMKIKIRKLEKDLTKYKEYIPKMKLVAPVDGLVIYGDNRRRYGKIEIKVGMNIRRGNVLITIPDLSQLIVDFDIPEQYRTKISSESKAIITPEAIPTLKIDGVVQHIDSRPVNQIRWDPNSPKIYHASLDILGDASKLITGMNVKVAIINKVLKERLIVPIEAVFEKNGKYFVYIKTISSFKEADVNIGEANDNFVEIKKGLSENDSIYLYRPYTTENNSSK